MPVMQTYCSYLKTFNGCLKFKFLEEGNSFTHETNVGARMQHCSHKLSD